MQIIHLILFTLTLDLSYEQTTEILSMWYPKLKAGGYMFGNNYLGSNRDWWYKSGDRRKIK